MIYKHGDIVLVYFPHTDFSTVKKRPALVVQADGLSTGLPNVVLAQLTSNLNRRRGVTRVFVSQQDRQMTGLVTDTVIVTDMLMTVETRLIDKKIGEMPSMQSVDEALRATLGL
jgi:mRNA interferase MazF